MVRQISPHGSDLPYGGLQAAFYRLPKLSITHDEQKTTLAADVVRRSDPQRLQLIQSAAHAHDRHLEPFRQLGQVCLVEILAQQIREDYNLGSRAKSFACGRRPGRRTLAQVKQCFGDIELRPWSQKPDLALDHLTANGCWHAFKQQEDQANIEMSAKKVAVLDEIRGSALSQRTHRHE